MGITFVTKRDTKETVIREDLKKKGWSDAKIDSYIKGWQQVGKNCKQDKK